MGAEIVTASCDTKFVRLAWRTIEGELEDVRCQMASDPTGKIARMFGVQGKPLPRPQVWRGNSAGLRAQRPSR